MKTKMISYFTLALFLVSCSHNETFDNTPTPGAIKFKNLNDRVHSRVANDNNSDYGVYAVLNGENPPATGWFMQNQQVNGTDDSYTPLKYWPATGVTVNFYAYAPHDAATLSLAGVSWNNGTPTYGISYTVPAAGNEDLTIAKPATGKSATDIQVDLEFTHQLSKVDFEAALAQQLIDDGFVLTLNSVSLEVAVNQGTNTLSDTTTPWSNLAANPVGTPVVYSNASSYMIMPQSADGAKITLNVTITHNGGPYLSNQNLNTIVLTPATLAQFVKGNRYVFKATVGTTTTDNNGNPIFNVIVFNSILAPWTTNTDIVLPNP